MKLILMGFLTISALVIFNSKTDSYAPQDPLKESMERGSEIYTDFCITCHMPAGEGVTGAFPPLAKSDYLMNNREASIKGIKYGQSGEITVNDKTYNSAMAAMGLSDDEVADVMNYITNSWGNKNDKMITEEEVSNIKK